MSVARKHPRIRTPEFDAEEISEKHLHGSLIFQTLEKFENSKSPKSVPKIVLLAERALSESQYTTLKQSSSTFFSVSCPLPESSELEDGQGYAEMLELTLSIFFILGAVSCVGGCVYKTKR